MRVIREGRRGCGKRQSGGVYLVGEGSPDGILPMWVVIDPPVPYDGEHFRGTVHVDLDAILDGLPQSEWLVGASEKRERKQALHLSELDMWGMTLKEREATGRGLETLKYLSLYHCRTIAGHLRVLAEMRLGKAQGEISRAFKAMQDGDPQQVLACLWRLWKRCPPKRKYRAGFHIRSAMYRLGTIEDAHEIIADR